MVIQLRGTTQMMIGKRADLNVNNLRDDLQAQQES
jgi:hypothetical protein